MQNTSLRARKIGAVVFVTFEDIVEVKPKMILLLLASLMAVDMGFDEVDGAAEDIEIVDDDVIWNDRSLKINKKKNGFSRRF